MFTYLQGNHYAQEGHLVGSQHCTQVSVELKRARSLVRIAEIQSTLQEQRYYKQSCDLFLLIFLWSQIKAVTSTLNSYLKNLGR